MTPRIGSQLSPMLRAFASRNYRLFFAGQSISLVGTWMQQVAMSWLVYRLTGSALLLGTVGFASQFPTFILAPLAGVLADRWNRRHLLLATQILAMLQATLLATFVLSGQVQVWQLISLSVVLGLVNAFDIPVRQSFLSDLVARKEDLGNAIALNSSMVTGARLIGPTIAGVLVAAVGEGICFVVNAASYLGVIMAIGAMRIEAKPVKEHQKNILGELREGVVYAFGFPPIRYILALMGLISLMGMPYAVLMPIFAKEVLHGNAQTYGFLLAAAGAGALASTLYLASRRTVLGLGKIITGAAILFGSGIIGFSLSRHLALSLPCLFFSGAGAMAVIAGSMTILQSVVESDKRGRVMSLFTMSFMGMTPIGSLLAGLIANHLGPQLTLICGGIACGLGGFFFGRQIPTMRKLVRPIYQKRGIIREGAPMPEQPPEKTEK